MQDLKPVSEWTDDELERRVTRYEGLLRNKIEEAELTELLLGPMRAEAIRRGYVQTEWHSWQKPARER